MLVVAIVLPRWQNYQKAAINPFLQSDIVAYFRLKFQYFFYIMTIKQSFTNHLHLEVLNAHLYHYLNYTGPEVKFDPTCEGEGYCPYPPNFFKMYEDHPVFSLEDIERFEKQDFEDLLALPQEPPLIDGVQPPTVKYNRIFGFKLNLKEITVPLFDGKEAVVTFKYHFYRPIHLFRYLFTRNVFNKAGIYNEFLKTRIIKIYSDHFQLRGSITPQKQSDTVSIVSVIEGRSKSNYTLRKQCYAVTLMLTVLGVDFTRVNITDVARLMHFLLDKELPVDANGNSKMANSRIYKMLISANEISNLKSKSDYKYVQNLFLPLVTPEENTGVKQIINLLDYKI